MAPGQSIFKKNIRYGKGLFYTTLWDHGGPIRPPKQQCIPPKQSIFPERPQLCVTTESVDLKSKFKPPIHPPHPHPSPETPYQHPGTMGGPIRPPKQQYIPPKQSIFPEHLGSWITTGSIGPKSKVKPPTHPPHPHPSPGTPHQHSGTTGGPIRPPKQQYIPPKRSIFPERPQSWVTTSRLSVLPVCLLGWL